MYTPRVAASGEPARGRLRGPDRAGVGGCGGVTARGRGRRGWRAGASAAGGATRGLRDGDEADGVGAGRPVHVAELDVADEASIERVAAVQDPAAGPVALIERTRRRPGRVRDPYG